MQATGLPSVSNIGKGGELSRSVSLLLTYGKVMSIFTDKTIVKRLCHANVEPETADYDTEGAV